MAVSEWRPGRHRQPIEIMARLRRLGIDLLGARNTALQSLAVAAPEPLAPNCSATATTPSNATPKSQLSQGRDVTKTAVESN
jgi:hypothetical protein